MSYKEVSIIDEIDRLLHWFSEYENKRKSHSFDEIYRAFKTPVKDPNALAIDVSGNFKACLNKLMKDGLIETTIVTFQDLDNFSPPRQQTEYRITYDGLLFLEDKISYRMEREKADKQSAGEVEYKIRSEIAARRLNILTAYLAVGSIALAISEAFKVYNDPHLSVKNYIALLAIFSAPVIITLILRGRNKPQ